MLRVQRSNALMLLCFDIWILLELVRRYNVVDLDAIGGLPMVMRGLLDAGLLHGDCLTVTGKTVAENLKDVAPPPPNQDIIAQIAAPIAPPGTQPCSTATVQYSNRAVRNRAVQRSSHRTVEAMPQPGKMGCMVNKANGSR